MSKRGTYNVEREEQKSEAEPTRWTRFKLWWAEFKQKVKITIHNPSTGEYLTRTPRSWGEIGLFYLVFYSALAAFFAICMSVFLLGTVPAQEDGPKFTHIICTDIGWKASVSKAIDFPIDNGTVVRTARDAHTEEIKEFLKSAGYDEDEWRSLFSSSSSSVDTSLDDLELCNRPAFGQSHRPCVYFRFNRIADYVPADDVRVQCKVDNPGNNLMQEFRDQVILDTDPSKARNDQPLIIYPHLLPKDMVAYDPANKDFQSPLFIALFNLTTTYQFVKHTPGSVRNVMLKCEPVLNSTGDGFGAISSDFEIKYRNID